MLLFTGNVPRGVFCEQSSQKYSILGFIYEPGFDIIERIIKEVYHELRKKIGL